MSTLPQAEPSTPRGDRKPPRPINGTDLVPAPPTPMLMIQMAVQQNADLDKLAKLMDLQERWEKNEAHKAFVQALADFKANPPQLEKNKQVDFQGRSGGRVNYKYATLDYVAKVLGQELSKHGLSFRWQTAQEQGKVRVTCFLQHAMGHGESVTLEGPADDTGNKNAIQQIGSTVTYLQRYTLLAATGMATAEQDNDGATITNRDVMEQVEWIKNARNMEELKRLFTNAYKEAAAAKNKGAMALYLDAKNKRKAELQ